MPENMKSEIVISGMSGRFPDSDNVAELYDKLVNKVDLVAESDKRWKPGVFGVPRRVGLMKDIRKFDNEFFGLDSKTSNELDPQVRIMLEVTNEAIIDAGYDPRELRGRRIGVYMGYSFTDTFSMAGVNRDMEKFDGKEILVCKKDMLVSRIFHEFDFKGPSLLLDTGCSSSGMALYEAFQAIRKGDCEAALVCGTGLLLRPEYSLSFQNIKMLSDFGKCKAFDASAAGFVRSEAITALFIQRYEDARRNYTSIVHMKARNDGFKVEGLTYPSYEGQKRLICEVLKECNLDPCDISHIEAHGTGTPAGDLVELSAISDVFCSGREKPLLIGSVKSNMGHTESSAAHCQIVKLILSMENGMLLPNIHFEQPRPEIKALTDGRLKVVTELTPWDGPYAAFSSFGFGGANVHGILKFNSVTSHTENKKNALIPQLVLYCGRTEESVQSLLDSTTVNEAPREFFALLHKSSYISPKLKPYRGYKILGIEDNMQDIKLIENDKQQLWYVFSGICIQSPTMIKNFLQIEVFAKSFEKSAEILRPFGLDLIEIVTSKLKSDASKDCQLMERSIISSIVTTVAVQIAFVDVLNNLDVMPDGIIGQSLGELGCAYADGCLTAEQVLLTSYWIAKVMGESVLNDGETATLSMPWDEKKESCTMPASHYGEDSAIISESIDKVNNFRETLKAENNLNKHVWGYILPVAKKLQSLIEKVIPSPKLRNSRWISSAYPKDKWDAPEAKFASALYFVHSLVSPMLLDDALRIIPKTAIVVELGPHELLDVIQKKKNGPNTSYISLMEKDGNNIVNLLSSIGKLYISGFNTDIEKLYPPVSFPVPRGTPAISPLIKWDYSSTWNVYVWNDELLGSVTAYNIEPGPVISPVRYILDHCIDGRSLFPASGYIVLTWKTFAKQKLSTNENELSVAFENVKFMRATILSETTATQFIVHISKKNGAFEVCESGMPVCTGFISSTEEHGKKCLTSDLDIDKKSLILNKKDVYKEFRVTGYEYGPAFKGIIASDLSGSEGILKADDNWVTYLDTMFQFSLIALKKRILLLPIGIQRLTIDPFEHKRLAEKASKEYEGIPVKYDVETRELFSAGVYAKNMTVGLQKKRPDNSLPLLLKYKFVPYETSSLSDAEAALYKEYVDLCSSISKKIFKLSKINTPDDHTDVLTINDDLINKYANSEKDCYVLLKLLLSNMNIPEDIQLAQNVKACVNSYVNELENDILSQILLNESTLKIVADVIVENIVSKKIKLVEVVEGSCTVSSKMYECFPVLTVPNTSYSIVHCNKELLCKDNLPPNSNVITWENKPSLDFKDVDIFILNDLKCSVVDIRIILENASACLKDEGFILLLAKTRLIPAEVVLSSVSGISIPRKEENSLEELFQQMNLNIICKMADSFTSTLYLLRRSKKSSSSCKDWIIHVTDEYTQWVDDLREKIIQSLNSCSSERIWLVSESCPYNGIIGLVNCLRQEPGGSNIRCVFTGAETSEIPKFSLTNPFYKKQLDKNLVMNVFQSGSWGCYRRFRFEEDFSTTITEQDAYLDVLTIGDLSSLAWIQSPMKNVSLPDNHVFCHVYYASMNFKDVMLATGRVPLTAFSGGISLRGSPLGFEFSGCTSDGRRVMGMVPNSGMATSVIANRAVLWDVPDEWSLLQAATVPTVYATAYYALIVRGRLQKGERVLIHLGSGGVGQAAINIALSMGCDIYTSVGTQEKKEFLKKKFPELKEGQIYNSRDTTFEKHILHATKGEGVHVVLNSLTEDKLFASVNCLAECGRFLEIGKFDLSNDSKLGMAIFLKNISFHGIHLDELICNISNEKCAELSQLLKEGIADGVVKPLNTTIFNHDQAEQAFRYMGTGKHIGKVVLKIRDEEIQKKAIPAPKSVTVTARTTFDSQKSYIIIGGLGGFGLELCQWLIDRGARNIILTSRSGVTTGYQKLCLRRWEQDSINVVTSKLNAIKIDEARNLVMLATKLGPVGGIFNLALVLSDAFMQNQTVQKFLDVCECKIEATKNMDLLTRELCPELDWFVCFSSLVSSEGNAGQSNYAYGNSAMERICEERVNEGLPGIAIQWGAIGDVGFVEDTMGPDAVIAGTVPQRISSCLTVLDKFLQHRYPVVISMVPYQSTKDKKLAKGDLLAYVAGIFGIKDIFSINPEATMSELGMDSLMAVELKLALELNFDTFMSLPELQKLKVKALKKIAAQERIKDTEETSKTQPIDMGIYFGKFYPLTSKDLFPTDVIVHMNAVKEGLPLVFIHPFEGSVRPLQSLAEILPCPVYGIQFTLEAPRDSFENLASWYWKNLKSSNCLMESINLAGYSFGAPIAFEMALQAEQNSKNHPEVKNLILLDGSHNLFSTISRLLSLNTDGSMENVADEIAILKMFATIFSEDIPLNKKELFDLKSFSERLDYTIDKISCACPSFKTNDIQVMFDPFRSKFQMSAKYNPKYKLKSDVYLFKPSESFVFSKSLTEFYDLDRICEGKITSNTIEGNHTTFIQGNSAKEISSILKESFQ